MTYGGFGQRWGADFEYHNASTLNCKLLQVLYVHLGENF